MLTKYHRQITKTALEERFSPRALEAIIAGNLGLDNLRGQFGHDEYHFDNNAFAASTAFIETQRALVPAAIGTGDLLAAWTAFGRLTHTSQDLYAHSNYVSLWRAAHPESAPDEIDPLNGSLLSGPRLRSGRLYYPLEALSFIPGLKKLVIPLLPKDSHAQMNLDSPERGENFAFAFAAALKRTRHEYERTLSGLGEAEKTAFHDQF
jgi:hypothetical protein